jgi:hypothetical protein
MDADAAFTVAIGNTQRLLALQPESAAGSRVYVLRRSAVIKALGQLVTKCECSYIVPCCNSDTAV